MVLTKEEEEEKNTFVGNTADFSVSPQCAYIFFQIERGGIISDISHFRNILYSKKTVRFVEETNCRLVPELHSHMVNGAPLKAGDEG